jgi:hypothetical protein
MRTPEPVRSRGPRGAVIKIAGSSFLSRQGLSLRRFTLDADHQEEEGVLRAEGVRRKAKIQRCLGMGFPLAYLELASEDDLSANSPLAEPYA